MTDRQDRRTNHPLRRRVDELIARVHAAREEIVERGLDAVHTARTAKPPRRTPR